MNHTLRFTLLSITLITSLFILGCGGDDDPVIPPSPSGTIEIDLTPNSIASQWDLSGPDNYSLLGNGDLTLTDMTPGDYTLLWGPADGWITPANTTQALATDETITFSGTYSPLDVSMTFVREVGTHGSDEGQFDEVADIAVDPNGNFYVCDFLNNRVQKFSPDGTFLHQIDHTWAQDIETDDYGNVYVWGNSLLYKYNSTGTRLDTFHRLNYSTHAGSDNHFAVSLVTNELATLNISGPSVSVWDGSAGAYSDFDVENYDVLRVQKADGKFLSTFGGFGINPGEFGFPYTTDYDSDGLLYVLDATLGRIQIFDGDTYLRNAPVEKQMSSLEGFNVDHAGRLYFRNGTSLVIYSADGSHSQNLTVGYTSHTFTLCKYIETWYDEYTDSVLLFVSSRSSVFVYRLEFENW